jgi:hypothetical protein
MIDLATAEAELVELTAGDQAVLAAAQSVKNDKWCHTSKYDEGLRQPAILASRPQYRWYYSPIFGGRESAGGG